MKTILTIGGIAIAAIFLPEYGAPTYSGTPRVIDGDTLAFGETRIRLWGVNSPDHQTLDYAARQYLRDAGPLYCVQRDIDRYKRVVAQCYTKERKDVGGMLIANGLAFDWPEYSKGHYRDHEEAARSERLGFWATQLDKK